MNKNENKKTISDVRREYKRRLANGEVVFRDDEYMTDDSIYAPVEQQTTVEDVVPTDETPTYSEPETPVTVIEDAPIYADAYDAPVEEDNVEEIPSYDYTETPVEDVEEETPLSSDEETPVTETEETPVYDVAFDTPAEEQDVVEEVAPFDEAPTYSEPETPVAVIEDAPVDEQESVEEVVPSDDAPVEEDALEENVPSDDAPIYDEYNAPAEEDNVEETPSYDYTETPVTETEEVPVYDVAFDAPVEEQDVVEEVVPTEEAPTYSDADEPVMDTEETPIYDYTEAPVEETKEAPVYADEYNEPVEEQDEDVVPSDDAPTYGDTETLLADTEEIPVYSDAYDAPVEEELVEEVVPSDDAPIYNEPETEVEETEESPVYADEYNAPVEEELVEEVVPSDDAPIYNEPETEVEETEEVPVYDVAETPVTETEDTPVNDSKRKKSGVKKTKRQLKPKRQVAPLTEEELEVLDSSFSKLRDQIAQRKKEEKETKKKEVASTPVEGSPAIVETSPIMDNLFSEDLYSQRISDLEEQINDLKIDNDELQTKLDEYSQKCQEQEQTIEVLEARPTTTVVQESVFGLDKFDELENQISELKTKISQLEEEKLELQAELSNSNFEVNDLTALLKDSETTLQGLKEDYDTLHQEFASYKSIKFSELEDGSLKQENVLLKEALQSEKINNEKLNNVVEQEKEKNVLLTNELNTIVSDKNQIIAELENTIRGCQVTIENKLIELNTANQELLETKENLLSVKEELAQANIQISNLNSSSTQNYNHQLESQLAALANAIEKLSVQHVASPMASPAPVANPYYMYEQERQVRQLREEMNSKFEEQERQKYNLELEKLKAEVSSLHSKLSQSSSDKLVKADQELDMIQSEIDDKNTLLQEFNSEEGIQYTKDDINDPNFKREYDKLQKQIDALLYDISEDTKRYNVAVSRNTADLSKREMMIEQIDKELENLINQYHHSSGHGMDYKEIYERERIKATEKIRFHNERIREIVSSNETAAKKHQAYMMEKNHQIEILRTRQDQLLEFYVNKLLEENPDALPSRNGNRHNELQNEINHLRSEHEEKSKQLVKLTSEVKTAQTTKVAQTVNTAQTTKVVPTVNTVPVPTSGTPVVQPVAPVVDPMKEKRIEELRKTLEEYKTALTKLRLEQEKRITLEKEMRIGDEMVAEYYTFYTSLSGLKEDQEEIAQEKKLLNANISDNLGDPNRRQEVLASRARLEDLAVREQDTLSKISYTNNRLRELIRDPEVIKYQNLVANMTEIQKRIDSLKTKIIAKNNELRALADAR